MFQCLWSTSYRHRGDRDPARHAQADVLAGLLLDLGQEIDGVRLERGHVRVGVQRVHAAGCVPRGAGCQHRAFDQRDVGPSRACREIVGCEVARQVVPALEVSSWRGFVLANGTDFFRAAGREGTSLARGIRVPGRVLEHDAPAVRARHKARHGRQQRLRVGVEGRAKDGFGRSEFNDLTEVHDSDGVRKVTHDGEVVGYEDQRRRIFVLEVVQQVDDCRLHRHVERRDRFVGDDDLRIADEGPGDCNPLLLAAGQLVRIALFMVGRKPDDLEHAPDSISRRLARQVSRVAAPSAGGHSRPCGWGSTCCRDSETPSAAVA